MLSVTTLLEHISLSKKNLSTLAYEPTFFILHNYFYKIPTSIIDSTFHFI